MDALRLGYSKVATRRAGAIAAFLYLGADCTGNQLFRETARLGVCSYDRPDGAAESLDEESVGFFLYLCKSAKAAQQLYRDIEPFAKICRAAARLLSGFMTDRSQKIS